MTDQAAVQLLECHGYVLVMVCPDCAADQSVYVALGTTHTSTAGGGTLRPTMHAKSVDHVCGQPATALTNVAAADLDANQRRLFDVSERAAGEHLDPRLP